MSRPQECPFWKSSLRGNGRGESPIGEYQKISEDCFENFVNGFRSDYGRHPQGIYKGTRDSSKLAFGLRFMEDYQDYPGVCTSQSYPRHGDTPYIRFMGYSGSPLYTFERPDVFPRLKLSECKVKLEYWHEAAFAMVLTRNPTTQEIEGELQFSSFNVMDDCTKTRFSCKGNQNEILHLLVGMFELVSKKTSLFMEDNRLFLWALGRKCIGRNIQSNDQFTYMEELHHMNARYVGLSRRTRAVLDIADFIARHPFFTDTESQNLIRSNFGKNGSITRVLVDYVKEAEVHSKEAEILCKDVVALTSLKEARASTELAKSARLITILTLLFLPAALAAAAFGMNVKEITGDTNQPSIWIFCMILAFSTIFATSSYWYLERLQKNSVNWNGTRQPQISFLDNGSGGYLGKKGQSLENPINIRPYYPSEVLRR